MLDVRGYLLGPLFIIFLYLSSCGNVFFNKTTLLSFVNTPTANKVGDEQR